MLHDSQIPSDGTLLTRFKMRRLRLAMTTVSHIDGNRATTTTHVGAAAPGCPAEQSSAACGDGRPRPSSPSTNRTFSLFRRHCANSAPVPVFPHAAETLIDVPHALLSIERMRRRPKASCHHLRKMDFRQVAQRNRAEAARHESPSVICGYTT